MSGVLGIRNMLTGMVYYLKTDDLAFEAQRLRFSLDMGDFPVKSLQDDYEQTGLELFLIEPACQCELAEADRMLRSLQDKAKDRLYR
jgi:hypothetical protein